MDNKLDSLSNIVSVQSAEIKELRSMLSQAVGLLQSQKSVKYINSTIIIKYTNR